MNLAIMCGGKGGGAYLVVGCEGPCQSEHCLWCLGKCGIIRGSMCVGRWA